MAYKINEQGYLVNDQVQPTPTPSQPIMPPKIIGATPFTPPPAPIIGTQQPKPIVVGNTTLPNLNNSAPAPTTTKVASASSPTPTPYLPPTSPKPVAPAPTPAIQTSGYDQNTGMPTGWTPAPSTPPTGTGGTSTTQTSTGGVDGSKSDPWAPDPNNPGYDHFGNPLQNYKPPTTGTGSGTGGNYVAPPTFNTAQTYLGPTPEEIEKNLAAEKAAIQQKYDLQREQAKRDTENERKVNISNLYSVGEANPLSSGVNSMSNYASDVLTRRLASIDQLQSAEFADATNRAYKQKSDYATNARQAQLDENDRIQQSYTNNRQALADSVAAVKAGQDRTDKQKSDAWGQTKELLTMFGSRAFDGLNEEALNNIETASGLSKGTLVKGLKTIKEQELLGKAANLKEVDGSLYNVTTDADGNLKATLVVKGTSKSESGLTAGQINTTVNQIAGAFDNEPAVKNFVTVKEGFDFVQNILNKDNPTSTDDQGLVYAFAKAMDPNSAVKEGEYTTVQKYSQSLIEKGWANAKRFLKNEAFLTPQARENMMATIKSKYDASMKTYQQVYNEYQRQISDAYMGKPRQITDYSGGGMGGGGMESENDIRQGLLNNGFTAQEIQEALDSGYTWEQLKAQAGFNNVGADTKTGSGMRTDRHNNPTAFTTDIAKIAGLREGVDYVRGDSFGNGKYYTAKLLGDPVNTTIRVIDKIGFYTQSGKQRWTHTAMTQSQWNKLNYAQKVATVKKMYQAEGNKGALNQYFA